MAVDLMQAVRASAFTVLVGIAKDTNVDVGMRLQAVGLILNYTQEPGTQDWNYEEPDTDEELPDRADEEAEQAIGLIEEEE